MKKQKSKVQGPKSKTRPAERPLEELIPWLAWWTELIRRANEASWPVQDCPSWWSYWRQGYTPADALAEDMRTMMIIINQKTPVVFVCGGLLGVALRNLMGCVGITSMLLQLPVILLAATLLGLWLRHLDQD